VDLPELDLFHIVQISGGAQHQKQCLAVMLQLRTLVAGWCILEGQMAATLCRRIRSANSGKDSVPEKPGQRGPLLIDAVITTHGCRCVASACVRRAVDASPRSDHHQQAYY
jgi:hypothetical protein